jgi:N-acetylmuramoyl-L-alanine amidase
MGPIAPAILIEIGFISNKKEAEELKKNSYQRKIAQGICAGIKVYFKEKAEASIA